jgi:hypothetical protein
MKVMFASFSQARVDAGFACIVLILSGCGRVSPDSAKQNKAGPIPNTNWREKYGMPTMIVPDQITFATPAVRERFLAADAAARKIARPDWAERAGDTYPYMFWNSGSSGFLQTYSGSWARVAVPTDGAQSRRPNHTIRLWINLFHNPRQAYGFRLEAELRPETGWSASFNYILNDGLNGFRESFALTLDHPELLPGPPVTDMPRGLCVGTDLFWSASRPDKQQVYRFEVRSISVKDQRGPREPIADKIVRYWSSAASFRHVVLEKLNRLEENARVEISSGEATSVYTFDGSGGGEPPIPVFHAKIPEAITADVLKEAIGEIEKRKKLVREHYQGMHAAVIGTFPTFPEVLARSRTE